MEKKRGPLGFLRSDSFKYAVLSLGAVAVGIVVIIPLSGVIGILWTVMSAAFGVYSVLAHRFTGQDIQPTDVPDRPEDEP